MSTTTQTPAPQPPAGNTGPTGNTKNVADRPDAHEEAVDPKALPASARRAPLGFGLLALVSLIVFAFNGPDQTVTFRISGDGDLFQVPNIVLPGLITGWVITLALIALTVFAFLRVRSGRLTPTWAVVLYGFLFVSGFLVWVVGSANSPSVSLTGLLAGGVALAVPLVFGSLGGLMCERSGVVNIAIEGQLLFGAFSAAVAGSISGSAWVGLLAAMIGAALVSLVLAVFSITYRVNQVIVGVVLNVLVSGLTGFLFATLLESDSARFNSPPRLPSFAIPFLSDLPLVGRILFDQSVVGYFMCLAIPIVWFAVFRSRWGLRTRAIGEHPKAADTLGINVNRMRFMNVLLGGLIAGIGGSFYTLVSVTSFTRDMTSGAGYIALAALIFGRWNPIGAFLAALLFGFASNLQSVLSFLGTPMPSQFLAMLPYVITILAVAGLVGASRGPAAAGQPYVKE